MGQKSNPTSLRLEKTNKHFPSCWYGDFFYKILLDRDLRANAYLIALFEQLRYPTPLLLTQNLYKKWRGYTLFLNPLRSRHEKGRFFRLERFQMSRIDQNPPKERSDLRNVNSSSLSQSFDSPLIPLDKNVILATKSPKIAKSGGEKASPIPEKQRYLHSLLLTSSLKRLQNKQTQPQMETLRIDGLCLSQWGTEANSLLTSQGVGGVGETLGGRLDASPRGLTKTAGIHSPKGATVAHLENVLQVAHLPQEKSCLRERRKSTRLTPYGVELHTIRAVWEGQSADLLAQEILYYLEKRISFRRIKYQIVREMERDSAIKGVRVNCSGRLGGRSKKAQKAKTESVQWGQTSLNVLSSKLSFSSKSGMTPFGKIGVKVWICYV